MIEFNKALEMLAVCAYRAYTNTLSGNNSPDQQKYFERTRKPEIGDIVLEISSISRAEAINRLGKLKSITNEPYPIEEDEEIDEEDILWRDIWTIETFDGREFRWENCSFITIPLEDHPKGDSL